MGKVIDFDVYRAEQKAEPVVLTIGGNTYELPPSIPASLALDVIRLNETQGADAEVPESMVITIGAGIFGGMDQFDLVLSENNITIDELPKLLEMVMEAYTGEPAPNRAARRTRAPKVTPSSSPNGASLKLISPESTT